MDILPAVWAPKTKRQDSTRLELQRQEMTCESALSWRIDRRAEDLCKPVTGDAKAIGRIAAYVTPQKEDWPEELFNLTAAEAASLEIIKLNCTYKNIRGGKSPVTSRKKTQVIKATWRRTDVQAGLPTAAARAAFSWLMEKNNKYKEYIKNHKRLLAAEHEDGDQWWITPTAEQQLANARCRSCLQANLAPQGIIRRHGHQDKACTSWPHLGKELAECQREFRPQVVEPLFIVRRGLRIEVPDL